MSGQLAKLFIRGSLINVTAKNLTNEQKDRVNQLITEVWNDKKLDSTKHKFCNVLGSTIGNEYKDKEFAMNEIWITIWRTAVDILYHHPRPTVIEDEFSRRKYFKQCIYMYMRQILNENKIPTYSHSRIFEGDATTAAKEIIEFYLDNCAKKQIKYLIEEKESDIVKIVVNMGSIPKDTAAKIWKIRDEMNKSGVTIMITDNSITIAPDGEVQKIKKKVTQKLRANQVSMSSFDEEDDQNNFQQHCEYNAIQKREEELDNMLIKDSIKVLKARLPENAQKVLELMINTPRDFMETYYPSRKKDVRPKESYMAEYLGMSKSEVSKSVALIQKQATALDIG